MRTFKAFFILFAGFLVLMLASCAYESKISQAEERFRLIEPKENILGAKKYYILSEAGICEAISTGRQDVDAIILKQSKFQEEVFNQFRTKLDPSVELIKVSKEETKQKIMETLKAEGRDNFYQPFGKDIDFYFYTKVMSKIAEKYEGNLIVPRLMVKMVDAAAGDSSGYARGDLVFDGVKRRVETSGSFISRMMGGGGEVFGIIHVVSMQLEVYSPQKLLFWSRAGYDTLHLLSTVSLKDKPKDKDLNEVFGEGKDAKENLQECVSVALAPLFGQFKK